MEDLQVEVACTVFVFGLAVAIHSWQNSNFTKQQDSLFCWFPRNPFRRKGCKSSKKRFGADAFQDKQETEFARSYSKYGYNGRISELSRDFPRKDAEIYLDHAGATLCSKSQVQAEFVRLLPARDLSLHAHSSHDERMSDPYEYHYLEWAQTKWKRIILMRCFACMSGPRVRRSSEQLHLWQPS